MADPIDITKNPFEILGQKGAQNLAATGSTGMKPVDTSIQANFLLQRGLATGSTPDEIMSSAQSQTQELQKELQSQLIAATTNSEMTPAQMVASSILQIAPILIGAGVSGKAGAMVGAKSGYAGSNNFLKLTEASRERTRQNAALQAKSIQSQIDSLNKQYQSAQTNKMNADLKREMAEFSRDTAITAASIRRQATEIGIDDPNAQAALEKAVIYASSPSAEYPNLTKEEIAAISKNKTANKLYTENLRLGTQMRGMEGIGERFETKRGDVADEREIGGLGIFPNEKPSETQATKAGEKARMYATMKTALDQLETSVAKVGKELMGGEAQAQATAIALLQTAVRQFTGVGANLTGPEVPYLKELLTVDPSIDGWKETAIKLFTYGGDPLAQVRKVKETLEKSIAANLRVDKYYIPGRPDLYDEDLLNRYPVLYKPPQTATLRSSEPGASKSSSSQKTMGAYPEGTVIKNKDGIRKVMRNGIWEDL